MTIKIPASKSHTIRQLLIASIAEGVSEIYNPLDSLDTHSCVSVCKALGAEITEYRSADPVCPNLPDENGKKLFKWIIKGNNGFKRKPVRETSQDGILRLNAGNSGTTFFLALAIAGIQDQPVELTGDEQIHKRSAAPLLEALAVLGIESQSRGGCAPIVIKGPWKGGRVKLHCPVSQYLSALLIAAPLAPQGTVTEIEVPLLNERPYIEMTLSYLKAHNISFQAAPDFSHFIIPGGSSWKALGTGSQSTVPADFSSAAFPAAAAAITGEPVTLLGLDPDDTQGDKFFMDILKEMGCEIKWCCLDKTSNNGKPNSQRSYSLEISRSGDLYGGTFDLNAVPDLLPAAAVTAAFAKGDTALTNATHVRLKETDRITVMAEELAKLGVSCTEKPDGLIIHGKGDFSSDAFSNNRPAIIDSRGDHRIVMAFAALGRKIPVKIKNAECAAVSYPGFLDLFVF